MRVLLVEDQKHMADAIEYILKKNKYIVDVVYDGEEAVEYVLTNIYDVIILDVMLPKLNGLQIIKKARENNINVPIILLTAKNDIQDKVKGFDCGADDYLTKPFETEELLARVRALTRRKGELKEEVEFKYKDIIYNKDKLVISCNKKYFELTIKEAKLFEILLESSEKIITKEIIISKLWSFDKVVIDNNVEVYISFLRKKLESLDTKVRIKTIRGLGYMLVGEKDV